MNEWIPSIIHSRNSAFINPSWASLYKQSNNFVDIYNKLIIVLNINYRQISNIRRTLIGNKTVDHSDVVGASPVGAAPTTSSSST